MICTVIPCYETSNSCLLVKVHLNWHLLFYFHLSSFAVSQVEYGIMTLVNKDDPRISVVLDCERISTLRFPMKMMKYCSTLMQDHYPNRLASLTVIRLPPVVRVLAQTFIQVSILFQLLLLMFILLFGGMKYFSLEA